MTFYTTSNRPQRYRLGPGVICYRYQCAPNVGEILCWKQFRTTGGSTLWYAFPNSPMRASVDRALRWAKRGGGLLEKAQRISGGGAICY